MPLTTVTVQMTPRGIRKSRKRTARKSIEPYIAPKPSFQPKPESSVQVPPHDPQYPRGSVQSSPTSPVTRSLTYAELRKPYEQQRTQAIQNQQSPDSKTRFEGTLQRVSAEQQISRIISFEQQRYTPTYHNDSLLFTKSTQQLQQEQQAREKDQLHYMYKHEPLRALGHGFLTSVMSYEDPLSLKSAYYKFTGNEEKVLETKLRAQQDVMNAYRGGNIEFTKKMVFGPGLAPAWAAAGGAVIGATTGAVKVAAPTLGKIAEAVIGIEFGKQAITESAPIYQQAYKSGDWSTAFSHTGMIGITSISGYYGYKKGSAWGMGKVERARLLSTKSGAEYIRTKGIFKSMDTVKKLPEPSLPKQTIDVFSNLQNVPRTKAIQASAFLRTEQTRLLGGRPRIGGSTSTYAQLPSGSFRTGNLPSSLYKWGMKRQYTARPRDFIGTTKPVDLDIMITGRWGSLNRAAQIKQSHVIDIPQYRPGEYLSYGYRGLRGKTRTITTPTKTPLTTKFMPVKEQFFRKGISILKPDTAYRTYKDLPDFWDIGTYFKTTTKNPKLTKSMHMITHPHQYTTPKYRIAPKIFKKLPPPPKTPYTPKTRMYSYYPTSTQTAYPLPFTTRYTPSYKTYTPPTKTYVYPQTRGYKNPYTSPKFPSYSPPKTSPKTPIYSSPKSSSYTPPYTSPKTPSYTPPKSIPYTSPKTPLYTPPKPPIPPSTPLRMKIFSQSKPRKLLVDKQNYGRRYKFREFKLPNLQTLFKKVGV